MNLIALSSLHECKYASVKRYWNLGISRIHGSMTAERCVDILKNKLEEFQLDLDKDIVTVTTDGYTVLRKVGRLIEPVHQLCLAHGIKLAIVDVLYKTKEVEETEKENFESDGEENFDFYEYGSL